MGAHSPERGSNLMEFEFLVRTNDDEKCEIASRKLPSLDVGRDKNDGGEEEEVKTPTSLDRRIPAALKCSPAPKKPKSRPLARRKEIFRKRIFLDLTKEIESLFPPAVRADLKKKIRKAR